MLGLQQGTGSALRLLDTVYLSENDAWLFLA